MQQKRKWQATDFDPDKPTCQECGAALGTHTFVFKKQYPKKKGALQQHVCAACGAGNAWFVLDKPKDEPYKVTEIDLD